MAALSILVVEDDPLVRTVASELFLDAGLDVFEAEDVESAIAQLWEHGEEIAAVFMDVRLPGHGNGVDLMGMVERHWPHVAIMLTSGVTDPGPDLPAHVTFFPKPWKPKEVITALSQASLRTASRTMQRLEVPAGTDDAPSLFGRPPALAPIA